METVVRGYTVMAGYNFKNIFPFYRDKRVFVTGHTGFKGTWLCRVLELAGAKVCGYALNPPTKPSLYDISDVGQSMKSVIGDIRDYEKLKKTFDDFEPEIVLHLAAQPIVRESYKSPAYTFETNVMGTVNICECVRNSKTVKSFVNVTTDKVYDNKERQDEGYREEEPLDGYDPYSNSKSCSELVTHSYTRSFFNEAGIAVSTARAGNVIGGGDFAADRIIPDCIRAVINGDTITVRNPVSIRPYQHVLEPVMAYLMIAMEQYNNSGKAGWYNVGPDDKDCVTTGELVDIFCEAAKSEQTSTYYVKESCSKGANVSETDIADRWENVTWQVKGDNGPHEAGFLKLNCEKLKKTFDWQPKWNIKEAVYKTVEFSKILSSPSDKGDIRFLECMDKQIMEYINV